MPRFGTATARSATPSSSTRSSGALRLFPDLIGFRPVPAELVIEWSRLFDVKGARAGAAGEADRRSPCALADRASGGDHRRGRARGLPFARGPRPRSAETRTACPRARRWRRRWARRPLADDPVGLSAAGWAGETPLWLYFLAESASRGRGEQLGPVRRPDRRRGPDRHSRRRSRLPPGQRPGLDTNAARARAALRPDRPASGDGSRNGPDKPV